MKNLAEVFEGKDSYVVCSTLNQIVNYIPIRLMESTFKNGNIKIFNITVKENSEQNSIFKRFDNNAWDKNLSNILEKDGIGILDNIYIKRNECNAIMNKLDEKILGEIRDGENELNSIVKKHKNEKQVCKSIGSMSIY